MNKQLLKGVVLAVLGVLITVFFVFDLGSFLSLEYIQQQRETFNVFYAENTMMTIAVYFMVYVLVTALSLPGAVIMTLLGGAVFGLAVGTVIVSFASTIGATFAFLASRFLLRDYVQEKFKDKLVPINDGMKKDGAFYLFTLRLIPIFPFFVINLLMGVTRIRIGQYFFVSQIGMLPGTLVFVNAGVQLGALDSLAGILSPAMLFSFALLGILPLMSKKMIAMIKKKKIYKSYKKPSSFDFNIVVIGGGSAGLVSSYIASAVKAKVALIEKHKMGGDCLNTGCVPSKALIRSAKMISYANRAKEFGFKKVDVEFDFAEVMERVQRVIKTVEPHDSVERYQGLGVDVITGEAMIRSPFEVAVNGKVLTTKNIIIATGARPVVPDIPGLDAIEYFTSDTIWEIRERPKRLLILGGGPIGCELAQAFNRLGSDVSLVQRASRVMLREDEEVSETIVQKFRKEGMNVCLRHKLIRIEPGTEEHLAICLVDEKEVAIAFDQMLVALGRKANITGFGLEGLGVETSKTGLLEADDFLRTNFPNIFVCGDVVGPYQFTHVAAHQAWYAAVNALFSPLKKFRVDYSVIPWATYTDPEVARVGLNELEAKEKEIEYEVTTYGIDDLDRAIADEEAHGLVKVLTQPGKDKILGVTIVGHHAGELIAEYVAAMRHGFGMNKILATIHIYPTLSEANKYAAGVWKKNHKPEKLLSWVEKFHGWRRH